MANFRNGDPPSYAGYLLKRGRRSLQMTARHFKLFDSVLECKNDPSDSVKWSINVWNATISRIHSRGILIVMDAQNSRIRLQSFTEVDACTWEFHLRRASQRKVTIFYDLQEVIGHGNFAEVQRGIDISKQETVAVKSMNKDAELTNQAVAIKREIKFALKDVRHPNVVRTLDVFNTIDQLFIVMEHGGTSLEGILEEFESIPEHDAALIISQLLNAVEYLHSRGIVHRDIKPANILLKKTEAFFDVKLADFGLSGTITPGATTSKELRGRMGTPSFLAPEVLTSNKYTAAVDLWSVGASAFYMLSGELPFDGTSISGIFKNTAMGAFDFRGKAWNSVSLQAQEFIHGLLQVDVKKRFTVADAKNHGWIKDAKESTVPKMLSEPNEVSSASEEGGLDRVEGSSSATKSASLTGSPGEEKLKDRTRTTKTAVRGPCCMAPRTPSFRRSVVPKKLNMSPQVRLESILVQSDERVQEPPTVERKGKPGIAGLCRRAISNLTDRRPPAIPVTRLMQSNQD